MPDAAVQSAIGRESKAMTMLQANNSTDNAGEAERPATEREADDLPQTGPTNGKPGGTKRKKASHASAITSADVGTDVWAARQLVAVHGSDLRYCHPWKKWLVWDGCRWKIDDTGEVERRAKCVIDSLWPEVPTIAERDRPAFIKMLQARSQRERLAAMIALAASEPGIPILPADLDTDPWLLNCPNGTLDLRTAEPRPHDRADLITKVTATAFNPDAKSYEWDQTLEKIFGYRQDLMDFWQKLVGYCLTGDTRENVFPILWGDGSNGKSTLLTALIETIGPDYAGMGAPDLLLMKKLERHPTEIVDLRGKRLVCCMETGDGRHLNEALVKHLTGRDRLKGRGMREDFSEFKATLKIVLCTNYKPTIRGTDHGIWRRIRLVPFTTKFWDRSKGETGPAELEADKALEDKLRHEAKGILAWAVRGCLQWQAEKGLGDPEPIRAATTEYRAQSDTIQRFLAECCVFASTVKASVKDLSAALQRWAGDEHVQVPAWRTVAAELEHRRLEKYTNNGVWWRGIGLVTELAEPTEPHTGLFSHTRT
jgi:putative DNA primase/helicase